VVLACALCAGVAEARPRAPEAYGPLTVHATRTQIPMPVDPRGPEGAYPSLAADVYVPTGGRRPYPLVQISHAWPGTLREFPLSGWARRLASRGFVVIVSDRRGATAAVTPVFDQPADLQDLDRDVNSEDILRVVRWAIARSGVRGSILYRRIDRRRLAIGGHSLGGYFATFAAVASQTEGPRLSALLLLDPTDERLGDHTLDSSLAVTPSLRIPTVVLASEANQHPVQCDMSLGPDCTIVSRQQYAQLRPTTPKLGLKVVGAIHEDVEDPNTGGTASKPRQLQMFQRYGMAWLEYWTAGDCRVAGYLGGREEARDQAAGAVAPYGGTTRVRACPRHIRRPG
jgi:dienelactone hydrolase